MPRWKHPAALRIGRKSGWVARLQQQRVQPLDSRNDFLFQGAFVAPRVAALLRRVIQAVPSQKKGHSGREKPSVLYSSSPPEKGFLRIDTTRAYGCPTTLKL